jgi:YggT family protein
MKILLRILDVLKYLILADVVLSWFMPDRNQVPRNYIVAITDPLYAPVRELLSPIKTGGIDFAPLAILLVVFVVQYWIRSRTVLR